VYDVGVRAVVTLIAAASLLAATEIPKGTQLQIRLTTAVNTSTAKPKQAFEAVVIAPVVVGGAVVLSAGTKVSGHVQDVTAAVKPDDQAVLELAFDQISDSAGHKASLTAELVGVDNARESVAADGKITGIIASQTGSGRMDQGINKVAEQYPGLADLLGAIKQTVVKPTDPNIDYEPGVEMTIELTKPLTWTASAGGLNAKSIEPADDLSRLVNAQPFRTVSEKPPKPSDMTNLMFLGSQQDIENAFQKAGWSPAAQLNSKSKLETFRAMAELRGYQEAPVSTLLLEGQPPDLVFEKLNNTFAARHHLRIWRRPERFHGKEVWVCSATHDTGIDYSEQNRTFIHKVDTQIDRERAKVVSDLLFTGLVQGIALVERPNVPTELFNATGDALETDGKMAVISF
jgi:LssY C-terminus